MINIYFNPTVSEANQQKASQTVDWVKNRLDRYFTLDHDLDIYFYQETGSFEESTTITGQTYESGVLFGQILKDQLDTDELTNFLFHELNHARKNELFSTEQHPSLFNWTLLEGLAQAFETEVETDLGVDWSKFKVKRCCSEEQLVKGLRQIITIDTSQKDWDYYDCFYNLDHQASLPPNFAYRIGDFLITKYSQSQNLRPSQILEAPNHKLLDFAKELV